MSDDPAKYGGKFEAVVKDLPLPTRVSDFVAAMIGDHPLIVDELFSGDPVPPREADPNPAPESVCTCGHDDSDHNLCFDCHTYQGCEFCDCEDYTNQFWQNKRAAKAIERVNDLLFGGPVDERDAIVDEIVRLVMDV